MARKLSADDRIELAYDLLESVDEDPEYERLVMEEIKRRCREIDEGGAQFLDGEEVLAKLQAELGSIEPIQEISEETVVARPLEEVRYDALQLSDSDRLDLAYAVFRDLEDEGFQIDWEREEVEGRSRRAAV